ncbi:MAG: cytochrome c maturation protein CcmE [Nitrospiria bacterium]
MKRLYLRWGGVLLVGLVIILLGLVRYQREVSAFPLEKFLGQKPNQAVRVEGMVVGGSLVKGAPGGPIQFTLADEGAQVPVHYEGEEPENLRELKRLVILGRWDPGEERIEAEGVSVVSNFGFVAWAYLVTLIPMGLFLFNMERKVALLYIMIKEEKVYQPEESA